VGQRAVEALVDPGEYRDDETLLVLVDDTGRRHELTMQHDWQCAGHDRCVNGLASTRR